MHFMSFASSSKLIKAAWLVKTKKMGNIQIDKHLGYPTYFDTVLAFTESLSDTVCIGI
jgi:hypothetical protein